MPKLSESCFFFFNCLATLTSTYHKISCAHHEYSIAVHNGVQSVSYGEHSAIYKFRPNCLLYKGIRVGIDVGSRLVQHHNPIVLDNSAGEAQQLFLTDAEVRSLVGHLRVQTGGHLGDGLLKLDVLERLPQLGVGVLVERIEIPSQASGEQERLLGDNTDLRAEVVQGDRAGGHAVYEDLTLHAGQAKESVDQGRLARAGSADDADLLLRHDGEADVPEDVGASTIVLQAHVLKLHEALRRPVVRRFGLRLAVDHRLLLQTAVLEYSLYGGQLALHLGRLSDPPLQHIRERHDLRDYQTDVTNDGQIVNDREGYDYRPDVKLADDVDVEPEGSRGGQEEEARGRVDILMTAQVLHQYLLGVESSDCRQTLQRRSEVIKDRRTR